MPTGGAATSTTFGFSPSYRRTRPRNQARPLSSGTLTRPFFRGESRGRTKRNRRTTWIVLKLRRMKTLAALVACHLLASATLRLAADPGAAAGIADNRECVVVLHGLARSSRSMSRLADRLSDSGFLVDNLDYPSTHEQF